LNASVSDEPANTVMLPASGTGVGDVDAVAATVSDGEGAAGWLAPPQADPTTTSAAATAITRCM
jgi:hypothetical protein